MTTQYNIDKYTNGVNGYGLLFSDQVFSATLVANADTTLNVPTTSALGAPMAFSFNKFIAVFSASQHTTNVNDVFIALNAAATVPAGAAFAATTAELLINGMAKTVKAGDVIHCISAGTPNVTVSFYAIQE